MPRFCGIRNSFLYSPSKKIEDILKGVHISIANRTLGLVKRIGINEEVTFTGGVSKNIGMVKALEEELNLKINVPKEPEFVVALGSALLAKDRFTKLQ